MDTSEEILSVRDSSGVERRKVKREKKDKGYAHLDASSEEDLLCPKYGGTGQSKNRMFGKKKEKSKDKRCKQAANVKRKEKRECVSGGSVAIEHTQVESPWRPIFGVPLAEAAVNNRSHDGVPLPVIFRQCIDFIDSKGLDTVGIYRISAPKSRLDELERGIVSGDYLRLEDVHEATGLLKRFLRQLPEHILTNRLQSSFVKVASECPCPKTHCCTCLTGDRLKAYLRQLPRCNYLLLAYLFRHAQLVVSHKDGNKMGLENMGLVLQATLNISQNLLRIFILNASQVHDGLMPYSKAATFLFDDVEIKRYVSPQEPDRLTENLPSSQSEIEDELCKQQSLLQQLHENVAAKRANGTLLGTDEQQLWDVQMVVTQLKRKLKLVKMEDGADMNDSSRGRASENDIIIKDGPTIEMFEEKQLLAVHMELKEKLLAEKEAIVELHKQLLIRQEAPDKTSPDSAPVGQLEYNDDTDTEEWKLKYEQEERYRDRLLTELIAERSECARLRAQLEFIALSSKRAPNPATTTVLSTRL